MERRDDAGCKISIFISSCLLNTNSIVMESANRETKAKAA